MTKIKTLLALASVLFATQGCGSNSAKGQQKADNEQQTATTEATSGAVKEIGKAEFVKLVCDYENNQDAWKYEGDKPAIVDFYATWCGPCKALAPIMAELAKEYDGKVVFYKVDVDRENELAAAFGVSSIPMLLWIPAEGDPFVSMGMMPKDELKKNIDERLLK